MSRLCEITRKKVPHPVHLTGSAPKRPVLLKRKIDFAELKTTVRLKVSEEGLQKLKAVGGLGKFLVQTEDKKLGPELLKLKNQLPEVQEAKKQADKKPEAEKVEAKPAEAVAAPAEPVAPAKEAKVEEQTEEQKKE